MPIYDTDNPVQVSGSVAVTNFVAPSPFITASVPGVVQITGSVQVTNQQSSVITGYVTASISGPVTASIPGTVRVTGSLSLASRPDVRDVDSNYILSQILMELRYLNFHMVKITGIENVEDEIDPGEDAT